MCGFNNVIIDGMRKIVPFFAAFRATENSAIFAKKNREKHAQANRQGGSTPAPQLACPTKHRISPARPPPPFIVQPHGGALA